MSFDLLKWRKYHPLTDKNAFICLVDVMGDDPSIVQAARASYDGFSNGVLITDKVKKKLEASPDIVAINKIHNWFQVHLVDGSDTAVLESMGAYPKIKQLYDLQLSEDRHLLRYLMNHSHTTPFEMVEFKFMVQVPMDCWRQWIRHRTANVNEYSTRYTEALDFFQVTDPTEWRLQSTNNKQGSGGLLDDVDKGEYLSHMEANFHEHARTLYQERLEYGVAKEQARKDLPLSTYTRAYWKCDLHNIFNFLRLRMDSHAQLEIRSFANMMFEIVKQVCPVSCEAFQDYVLGAKRFSRMELEVLREHIELHSAPIEHYDKPESMSEREWTEFLAKIQ